MADRTAFTEIAARTTTLTFDCYGTLIDWRAGLTRAFVELFGAKVEPRLAELFGAYLSIEGEVEAGEYRPYREVLDEVARRMARRLDLPLDPARAGHFAETLPAWPAFADTAEALTRLKRRFRLGVLSNIDRDLFAATAKQFPVAFDFVVTAEDVRSYKPSHGHFRPLFADHGDRATTIHVAQSLFHDGAPANALDLAYVWIDRYTQRNETGVRPLAEFTNLAALADALGCGSA